MILEKETFEKYGYLPSEKNRHSKHTVLCKCDYCGKIFDKRYDQYITCKMAFNKDACKEHRKTRFREISLNNINKQIGDAFGFWTIIGKPFRVEATGNVRIECQCICGIKRSLRIDNLKQSKSCGCKTEELKSKSRTTHNGTKTRLYSIWRGMKHRCKQTRRNTCYSKYGIKVCESWDNFPGFKEWAINNGYNDCLTIDRVNPYGNYCPENCKWVTKLENSSRVILARDNIIMELKEEIKILKERLNIT